MCQRFSILFFVSAYAVLLGGRSPANAYVYQDQNRWNTTAAGSTGNLGDPITLTWGIVADGTNISGEGASNLITKFDSSFGAGPGGSDLTQRPWFQYFSASFDRWSELSGITYKYQSKDDGRRQGTLQWAGNNGSDPIDPSDDIRADVRIGAATDIGNMTNILAYNYFPDNGDMVLDMAEIGFFSDSTNNYRKLRNTLMHEAGHGFGLNHVESNSSAFLLEPILGAAFDGPQFDDIRGIHALYGDFFEKSNDGQGNDTASLATSLGAISAGSTVSVGTDAADAVVSSTDIDFLSIDRNSDTDFFSLTVDGPSLLNVVLSPMGPTYNEAVQGGVQAAIDASALSDLSLAIFDADKTTLLGTSDISGLGFTEALSAINLPVAGEYFVRIQGDDSAALDIDTAQFYQLDLSVVSAVIYQEADFNQDGTVDADDFNAWQLAFGLTAGGDTDGDGDTDGADFLTWQVQFNGVGPAFFPANSIPEPSALGLALIAGLSLFLRPIRVRRV